MQRIKTNETAARNLNGLDCGRKRIEDIPLPAEYLVQRYAKKAGICATISPVETRSDCRRAFRRRNDNESAVRGTCRRAFRPPYLNFS